MLNSSSHAYLVSGQTRCDKLSPKQIPLIQPSRQFVHHYFTYTRLFLVPADLAFFMDDGYSKVEIYYRTFILLLKSLIFMVLFRYQF